MGDEPYTKQRATSAGTSPPSMNQRLAYANQRAEVLFGCYRRGDANDPDRYVAAIAAVLSTYDFELIREVTDPRTGICTDEKYMSFMPNAGELKRYCEAVAVRQERFRKLQESPRVDLSQMRLPAPMALAGDLAQLFVPKTNPRYPKLVEWAARKDTDPRFWKYDGRPGICVAFHIWDNRGVVARRIGISVDAVVESVRPENLERLTKISDEWREASTPMDREFAE